MDNHESLLDTIAKRDMRLRVANFVFAGTVIIGLVILLLLGMRNLSKANAQLAQQKILIEQVKKNSADRGKQLDIVNQHIDCIAKFFAEPYRGDDSISNIDTCLITK